jgi:hypothetical protein
MFPTTGGAEGKYGKRKIRQHPLAGAVFYITNI